MLVKNRLESIRFMYKRWMELTNISNAPDDTLKARVKRPSDLNGSIPTPAGR